MVKLSLLLTRRSDITRSQFIEYWTKVHVPLARAAMAESGLIRRYVHQYAVEGLPSHLPQASYDGVMEAWFDDMGGLTEAMSLVSASTAVAADEENFLDRAKTVMLISTEALNLWPD